MRHPIYPQPTYIRDNIIVQVKNGFTITRSGHAYAFDPEYIIKNKKIKDKFRDISCGTLIEVNYFLGNKNGTIYHSISGPARIEYNFYTDSTKVEYYINGFKVSNTRDYCYLCGMDDMESVSTILKYGDTLPTRIDGDPYGK